jgi:hypothetical protein
MSDPPAGSSGANRLAIEQVVNALVEHHTNEAYGAAWKSSTSSATRLEGVPSFVLGIYLNGSRQPAPSARKR